MWFDSPDKLARLQEVAASWVGTPFSANSRCKGRKGGVSCQMLAEQIYIECGLDLSFEAASGPMGWGGRHADSLIEKFMADHSDFEEVEAVPDNVKPGDLMGFKIGKCIHHVAVCIDEKNLIHCMRGQPTMICPLTDPTFKNRLAKIWRPV